MKRNIKLLLVEDDEDDYVLMKEYLKEINNYTFSLEWASSYNKALELVKKNGHQIYIFDYFLDGHTGLELLKETIYSGCEAPVIMLTGQGTHQADVEAMEMGAADFLIKSEIDSEKLERSIRYSIERNEQLKVIKESEAKYRAVFESSRDMIFISDDEGRFIDFNESATRIFGYSREELLRSSLSELYYNDDEKTFFDSLKLTGAVSNTEIELKNKNGEKKYCSISASLQRGPEGKFYIIGIVRDITRRKKAERDLLIAEKIAVTGRLAQVLAHEIRNPLTTITLVTSHLEADSPDPDNKADFDMIKNSCRRISELINEVLLLSKPAEVTMRKCNVNKLIDETLAFAMDRIMINNIEVVKDYSANLCEITVDEAKIKTALLNIIVNAIEAVPKEGGIIKIKTWKEEEKCYIEIEDNGTGISKENLGRLFEPYFTGKSHGIGLGLSATHNIIQSHKGTIEVESEPNKRTKFTVGLNI